MQRWYSVTVAGAVVVAGLAAAYWLYGPSLTPSPTDDAPPQAVQSVPVAGPGAESAQAASGRASRSPGGRGR